MNLLRCVLLTVLTCAISQYVEKLWICGSLAIFQIFTAKVSLSIHYNGYHSDEVFINRHSVKEVVSLALRCVDNLVTEDDVQTQVSIS